MLWHLISKTIMISGLNVIQGIDLLVAFSCCQQWTGTELMWDWDDPATVYYSMRFACFFKGRDLLIETQCTEHSHRSSRSDVKRYYATGHNLDQWAWGIPLYSSTTALRAWQWCPKVQKHRMYDTLILLPFLFSIALVAAQQGNISCSLRHFTRFDLQ